MKGKIDIRNRQSRNNNKKARPNAEITKRYKEARSQWPIKHNNKAQHQLLINNPVSQKLNVLILCLCWDVFEFRCVWLVIW